MTAPATTPPLYPDRCEVHGDEATPPPCGACADVRKANAARPRALQLVTDSKRCLIHDTSFVRACAGCEADRKAGEVA